MVAQLTSAAFWLALGNIILVNVVLSGDNAIVIALAARGLPPAQQRRAVVYGSAAAIILRIVLTLFAITLLGLPYLKIVGAVLLVVIGVQLLSQEEADDDPDAHGTLAAAVRTILIADLVMSLDNVLGVAAAAKGNLMLLVAGLIISIPLIVFGSGMMLRLMQRVPIIIVLGAALLGYLAGEMLFADVALQPWIAANFPVHDLAMPQAPVLLSIPGLLLGAGVVLAGRLMARGEKPITKA